MLSLVFISAKYSCEQMDKNYDKSNFKSMMKVYSEALDIGDYEIIRGDRTSESGKSRGGGVCVFVNHKWCNNWTVREKICTLDCWASTFLLAEGD